MIFAVMKWDTYSAALLQSAFIADVVVIKGLWPPGHPILRYSLSLRTCLCGDEPAHLLVLQIMLFLHCQSGMHLSFV